jgi:hypothetical protein
MRLNKDFIFKHIKDTKYPLWALYIVQNYRRIPLAFYNGDDFADEEKTEGKCEKSCIRLASTLQDFPPDAVLSIDLKNAKTANGSGILGPFEFVNMSKDDEPAAPSSPGAQFTGFGFANPPAGWVSEQVLNAKLDELRTENERKINELIFKQREKDFEERMARERRELEELRKELKDEKKKYESTTGAAATTLAGAAKMVFGQLFPGLGISQADAAAQLAGAGNTELPEAEPAQTSTPKGGKYAAIERLAGMLYTNDKITEAEVESLTQGIEAHLKTEQKEKEVQNA